MYKVRRRSTRRLFQEYAEILGELQRRGIVRSTNSPVSDYAEVLVCEALKLKRAPASAKGYDATDSRGRKYEIKGRRPTLSNPSRQLSAIRDLDGGHFDFLVPVLFDEKFAVLRACKIPAAAAKAAARYRKHVNAWIVHARDTLLGQTGVVDITERVKGARSYAG